ncbi:hypothetical protein MMC07_006135 [Pseudocyphellaria aurata]|nr:hypothetical protein [Pseudocyphellaria aurata]
MAFTSLPAELHVHIAQSLGNNDLINLCLTSHLVKARCHHVLYHHVDLDRHQPGLEFTSEQQTVLVRDSFKRQKRLVDTLLSHPEYAKYVRSFKGTLCTNADIVNYSPGEEKYPAGKLWSAMQSLTCVRHVEVGSRNGVTTQGLMGPPQQIPSHMFESATSVKLVGRMECGLAKSILLAVNPARLTYLCLDWVENNQIGQNELQPMPGDRGDDGQVIARDAASGLLTTLTGRCTALRTLILRRMAQYRYTPKQWHEAAEEASYTEWASFIHSVRGTLETLVFGHAANSLFKRALQDRPCTIMDKRFERLVLPTIVSGIWPCLTTIEIQGVKSLDGQDGKSKLETELKAVRGVRLTAIKLDQQLHFVQDYGVVLKFEPHAVRRAQRLREQQKK